MQFKEFNPIRTARTFESQSDPKKNHFHPLMSYSVRNNFHNTPIFTKPDTYLIVKDSTNFYSLQYNDSIRGFLFLPVMAVSFTPYSTQFRSTPLPPENDLTHVSFISLLHTCNLCESIF